MNAPRSLSHALALAVAGFCLVAASLEAGAENDGGVPSAYRHAGYQAAPESLEDPMWRQYVGRGQAFGACPKALPAPPALAPAKAAPAKPSPARASKAAPAPTAKPSGRAPTAKNAAPVKTKTVRKSPTPKPKTVTSAGKAASPCPPPMILPIVLKPGS
jgi:hypothetical protein